MSLEDIEAIKQLKGRYFRFLDTKQWEKWRDLFTGDCHFDGLAQSYTGPDALIDDLRERLRDAVTVHHGHMPEISITAEGAARGVWAMFDYVVFPEARDVGHGLSRGFTGYGHYEEEYRQTHGAWQISFLRLTRLRLDAVVGEALPPVERPWIPSLGRDWLADSSTDRAD
jgi:hypothetical protein